MPCGKHELRILLPKPLQRNTRNTEEHTVGNLEIFSLLFLLNKDKNMANLLVNWF